MIKGIIFDYGGTIDTNGMHWGEVIWMMYQKNKITVNKDAFKAAYSFGERSLAIQKHIFPEHNFLDTLQIKTAIQFDYLKEHGYLPAGDYKNEIKSIAGDCNAFAQKSVNEAKPVLDELSAKYDLVLVSNFYGNVQSVLTAFGIKNYFKEIVESAVVGVRKPDPQIFTLGVKALQLPAGDCVVIGDSYTKDIAPANAAGCKTIWLEGQGWGDDPADTSLADVTIKSFNEIPLALLKL